MGSWVYVIDVSPLTETGDMQPAELRVAASTKLEVCTMIQVTTCKD